VLAAVVLPAVALGQVITETKVVNLDGDPELEQVIPQETCTTFADGAGASACAPEQFSLRRLVIEDTCAGAPYAKVISSEQDDVSQLQVRQLDGLTPRPEVFFDLRSGATGGAGEVRIVRWDDGPPGGCPDAKDLFRYPTKKTRGRIPRGAKFRDGFTERIRNFTKRYAGLEIRVSEYYVDRDDANCCPSFRRLTWFGYSGGKDRYERYRTRVKRIKK
jgi:hypothetical protein